MCKKNLTVILVLTLLFSLFNIPPSVAEDINDGTVTLDLAEGSIIIKNGKYNQSNEEKDNASNKYVIFQTGYEDVDNPTNYTIRVEDDAQVQITLKGTNVFARDKSGPGNGNTGAFNIESGCEVTLIVYNDNTFTSDQYTPGIKVPEGMLKE